MDVFCQSFCHFLSTNIRNCVECKTVMDLVVVVQVFPDRVHDETEEIRILVHE